jgi:cytidylate kinase
MCDVDTIAIDGPAASGKSTLGKKLADDLGFLFFDTGVMYRAVTWAALERNLDIENEQAITQLAAAMDIDVRPPSVQDGRSYDVLVDGQDVTWKIRQSQVDENVSLVSTYPGVRSALTEQQRRIGRRGNVVMVGRDIGTVVMPEADLKIYLDASVEERARRRHQEILQRGEKASLVEIRKAMRKRDQIDSTRPLAPLRAATDAVIIYSDGLDADQVLAQVKNFLCNQPQQPAI